MKVTVGVSGGIAAYKAAELVRALQRQALDVHVVMTDAAREFIQPLTFAALTGHKVITGFGPPVLRSPISILRFNTLLRRSGRMRSSLRPPPQTPSQNSLMASRMIS